MTTRQIVAAAERDILKPYRVEKPVDKHACPICEAPRETFRVVEQFTVPSTGLVKIRVQCPRECVALWQDEA